MRSAAGRAARWNARWCTPSGRCGGLTLLLADGAPSSRPARRGRRPSVTSRAASAARAARRCRARPRVRSSDLGRRGSSMPRVSSRRRSAWPWRLVDRPLQRAPAARPSRGGVWSASFDGSRGRVRLRGRSGGARANGRPWGPTAPLTDGGHELGLAHAGSARRPISAARAWSSGIRMADSAPAGLRSAWMVSVTKDPSPSSAAGTRKVCRKVTPDGVLGASEPHDRVPQ